MSADSSAAAGRVVDADVRAEVIDPARSFIVQAPAGSGKTGLLTQRYLRLLATVDHPEEIVAITFTRKAAGEMRERIVGALHAAGHDTPPDDAHARRTWALARAARERDAEAGWGLTRHPARMRVQTIDSFNVTLTRQMPWMSGLGAPPAIHDNATDLHVLAARRVIARLEDDAPWADAIATLLGHLDNRVDTAVELLAGMLARRDPLLRHLLGARGGDDRAVLEAAFATETARHLHRLCTALPRALHDEIAVLAAIGAGTLVAEDPDRAGALAACDALEALPGADPDRLPQWLGIRHLLLTNDGDWRKPGGINKRLGFPTSRGDEKARLKAVLEALDGHDIARTLLDQVKVLPPARFDDAQEVVLGAIREVIRVAVAELQLVFRERGEIDHAESALRALRALGDEQAPTDLALALDHRIRHVLVDEFQDTSTSQFELLAALTRGWTPGDGRTLFLVGDPMQSIYRFREAEVGLFMRARSEGVGEASPERRRLAVNFRSRPALVDWVNAAFPTILGGEEDAAAGAVAFESSVPFDASADGGVAVHPQVGPQRDAHAEARTVVALARERLAETADGTVAVLVRGRRQLMAILPALRDAGLRAQAVEIESLAARPIVQDLLALTRALVHPGDRTAWLAVLRARWCGLALADLEVLAGVARDGVIATRLGDVRVGGGLSVDAQRRLARVAPVLQTALDQRRRASLRHRVETTWRALGGPQVAASAVALEDAEAFLALLEHTERAADLDDVNALDDAIHALYGRPDPEADARLQVMTIHKSKGLEFDSVILPGLDQGVRGNDSPLLQWMERPRMDGDPELLLAPVRAKHAHDHDPHYRFISALAREKDAHEQGRLLYVAVTRAIRRLDLLGWVRADQDDSGAMQAGSPSSGSLLARLWPAVEAAFVEAFSSWQPPAHVADDAASRPAALWRVPPDWAPAPPKPAIEWEGGVPELDRDETEVEYAWAGETARLVGIVVHRLLQQVAEDGLEAWDARRVEASRDTIGAMLATVGLAPEALDGATARAIDALRGTLESDTGRWVLAAHADGANELALSSWSADGPEQRTIDRTFVADGARWVIDYKTGYRAGGDLEGFLAQELERYTPAMHRYAGLMSAFDPAHPVRLALYFPLLGRLVEVPPAEA